MKEIQEAQQKWMVAKNAAQEKCEKSHDYEMARKLCACHMFTGDESLEEMITLMFSPQGLEFLTTNHFPDLKTFRTFKKYCPERYGVYIDCGEISLADERYVFLVGNTTAELSYEETNRNYVALMWGAKAHIKASGFSIVKVEKDDVSTVNVEKSDFAKVLL
jgi:hypothetical protein